MFSRFAKILGALALSSIALLPAVIGPTISSAQQPYIVDASATANGYRFVPAALTVPVGSTVIWTTETSDPFPHTVTSTEGGPLASPTIQPGSSFTFTFQTPGVYAYICRFHVNQGQVGTVIVSDNPGLSQLDQLRQWFGGLMG